MRSQRASEASAKKVGRKTVGRELATGNEPQGTSGSGKLQTTRVAPLTLSSPSLAEGDMVFHRIRTAVASALLAAGPAFDLKHKEVDDDFSCIGCFQLLGVDVMLDADLNPFVIEVNGSPSMSMSEDFSPYESQHVVYDETKLKMATGLLELVYEARAGTAENLEQLEEMLFVLSQASETGEKDEDLVEDGLEDEEEEEEGELVTDAPRGKTFDHPGQWESAQMVEFQEHGQGWRFFTDLQKFECDGPKDLCLEPKDAHYLAGLLAERKRLRDSNLDFVPLFPPLVRDEKLEKIVDHIEGEGGNGRFSKLYAVANQLDNML